MNKNTILAAVILLAAAGAAFWLYRSNTVNYDLESSRLPSKNNGNEPAVLADERTSDLWETKTSEEGPVTVTVTPKTMSEDDAFWEFEISLDTHSGDLSEDIAAVSLLAFDSGGEIMPLSWEGDPAGGHHRSGILKFQRPDASPKTVTLKIAVVGGVEVRIFTWNL